MKFRESNSSQAWLRMKLPDFHVKTVKPWQHDDLQTLVEYSNVYTSTEECFPVRNY